VDLKVDIDVSEKHAVSIRPANPHGGKTQDFYFNNVTYTLFSSNAGLGRLLLTKSYF
jgi:hypothetical protein